jgi:sporulation protein YlmC with PRC-barrel domain
VVLQEGAVTVFRLKIITPAMGTFYTTWTETTIEERQRTVQALYLMGARHRAILKTDQGEVSIPGTTLMGSIIIIEQQVSE